MLVPEVLLHELVQYKILCIMTLMYFRKSKLCINTVHVGFFLINKPTQNM